MSKYDINEPLNVWEDGLNNSRKRKQEWIDSLIEKYGFPVREENLLKEDFALHDMVKDDLAKMEKDYYAYQSQPRGSSLDDEDMERNAERGKSQEKVGKQTQYGDTTAKELDNYIRDYKLPKGKTRTGLLAPIYDFVRNYQAMEDLKLKESDKFFHCKANYEAASRGAYGALIAGLISVGREITDELRKGDSWEDIWSDIKADERGIYGGAQKKSLRDTCPTHHKKI